jgi:hypothetical protein
MEDHRDLPCDEELNYREDRYKTDDRDRSGEKCKTE